MIYAAGGILPSVAEGLPSLATATPWPAAR